jgi:tRNA(Ile)-lysidine synthase
MRSSASSLIDVDALFAPLADEASLLLAVSGGPDSIALMLLAARWSLREERDIAVATVDHGLRPESREEAQRVGEWARAQGFAHHILVWQGAKPKTRIQERAREMRYRLLKQCAKEIGATAIVTAHHADDQAETILFRLTRGSGVAGLAGMSPISALDELRLYRPLLNLRKQELEAICIEAGHEFLRDPSNENPSFARTQLRKLQTTLAAQGLDSAALLRLGARAARADESLAWSAAHVAASTSARHRVSEACLDANLLRELPVELLQRIIATEIARMAPKTPLRLERLERAAQRLAEAIAVGQRYRSTLGGAILTFDGRNLAIVKEKPRRKRGAEPPRRPIEGDEGA